MADQTRPGKGGGVGRVADMNEVRGQECQADAVGYRPYTYIGKDPGHKAT
jgi:hypothetical protein